MTTQTTKPDKYDKAVAYLREHPKEIFEAWANHDPEPQHPAHCGNVAGADDCDCLGAEPDCLFCNHCNREFAM